MVLALGFRRQASGVGRQAFACGWRLVSNLTLLAEISGLSLSYNAPVMLPKDLLDDLVCPACIQPLEYRESPESLKCLQCGRVYAVRDDIPIMLIDEAKIET